MCLEVCAIKPPYTISSSNQAFNNIFSRTKQPVQWLGHRLYSQIIVVIKSRKTKCAEHVAGTCGEKKNGDKNRMGSYLIENLNTDVTILLK